MGKPVDLTERGGIVAYPRFEPERLRGDSPDDGPRKDVCGEEIGWRGAINGFWGLVEWKSLDEAGQPLH